MMKKLREANVNLEEEGEDSAGREAGGALATSKKKTATPRKRKTAGDGEEGATQSARKKRNPKKKTEDVVESVEKDVEENETVKQEIVADEI